MNWDEYFFAFIDVIKLKSKDPATQVGCVIVGPNHEVRSLGFNGLPRGVEDDPSKVPERYARPAKYLWTEHAERNAIYNMARMGVSTEGCIIYPDFIPCSNCCRAIIQSGIKEIVVDGRNWEAKEKYWNERWKDDMDVSKGMMRDVKTKLLVRKYLGKGQSVFIEFDENLKEVIHPF